eukprot:6732789-Alexandrium_andersonii.AAC.1
MPPPAAPPTAVWPPIDDPLETVDAPGFQQGIESLLQKLAQHEAMVLQDSGRPTSGAAAPVIARPGKEKVGALIA